MDIFTNFIAIIRLGKMWTSDIGNVLTTVRNIFGCMQILQKNGDTFEETDQLYQTSYVVYRPTQSDRSYLQLIGGAASFKLYQHNLMHEDGRISVIVVCDM